MFSINSKQPQTERELVITLGNSGSSVSVVEKTASTKTNIISNIISNIIYSAKDEASFFEVTDTERFKSLFFASFKKMLAEALKNGYTSKKIQRVSIILSSPWIISRNKTLTYADVKPFTVRQSMIDDLVKASNVEVQSEVLHESMVCFDEKTTHLTLNGYATKSPIGKEASSLTITLSQSFIARSAEEILYEQLEKSFNKKIIHFYPLSLCLFTAISKVKPVEKEYLFFLVGDEITDIGLVRDGMLKDTVSIPKAKNYIIRALGEKLHATFESATSMLRLASENLLEKDLSEKVSNVLHQSGREWLNDVGKAAKELHDMLPLPLKTFMFSSASEQTFFSECLASDEYYTFDIEHMTKEDITKLINVEKGVVIDTTTCAEVIGVAMQ